MNEVISKMFKAYDLRGTPPDLSPAVYYWTGFAFVEKILRPAGLPLEVIVGHDCRLTSIEFSAALIQGVEDARAQCYCIGQVPTDVVYAATQVGNIAGIMITASHNPSQYNGAKFVKEHCTMIGIGTGLELVRDFVIEHIGEPIPPLPATYIVNETYLQRANDFVVDCILKLSQTNTKKLRIGIDAGNGMGGYYLTDLKKLFPMIEWWELYTEADGNFPHHMPDPTKPENIRTLQETVLAEKLDF